MDFTIGENTVLTDLQSDGTGNEYIAIHDPSGSYFYKSDATGNLLYSFSSFNPDSTTTFNGNLVSPGWQLGLGVSIETISMLGMNNSDLASSLTEDGATWEV